MDNYLSQHYAPSTIKTIKRHIAAYLTHCPHAPKATGRQVLDYIGQLRSRYSVGTISTTLASIKAWYAFLIDSGLRTDNPAASIRLRDKPVKRLQLQDLLTPAQLEELVCLPHFRGTLTSLQVRDKVIITLLIYQALLPKELEALQSSDVDTEQACIYIKSSPGVNARTLQLKPQQVLLFYRYQTQVRPVLQGKQNHDAFLLSHRGNPLSRDQIMHHINDLFKRTFPSLKITCGSIRQSVIASLLKAGHDIRTVQVFAGHRGASSTEKYKPDTLQELKQNLIDCHPFK